MCDCSNTSIYVGVAMSDTRAEGLKLIQDTIARTQLVNVRANELTLGEMKDEMVKIGAESLAELEALLEKKIREARIAQLDEIIDIQEKQFNRWTQKDIAFFFEKVGRIYRQLKDSKGIDDE